MLLSNKNLSGFNIDASDEEIGSVYNILLDDQNWIVRYIAVDVGGWLKKKKVLVAPSAVGKPDIKTKRMPIHLTTNQIENSPSIDTDMPVSRRQEIKLHEHYHRYSYRVGGAYPIGPVYVPKPPGLTPAKNIPSQGKEVEGADPHLRSTKEIINYKIHASDGDIGHVEGFIFDSDDWIARHLVVDTKNWLPGKKVVISPKRIKGISWKDLSVTVSMMKADIESSPEYVPSLLNKEIEQ